MPPRSPISSTVEPTGCPHSAQATRRPSARVSVLSPIGVACVEFMATAFQLGAGVLARLIRLDQLGELVELAGEARLGAFEQLQNMGIDKLVADTDASL